MSRILIVDDDRALARSLQIHLTGEEHDVRLAHTLADGWDTISSDTPEIVFLDLKLPDGDSRTLLKRVLESHPEMIVVMITGHQDMQATIEAIRAGAFDFIRKPLDLDQVLAAVAKAGERLRSKSQPAAARAMPNVSPPAREIVGRSPVIVDLLKQIAVLSETRVTVVVQGETGTGKELVARALHDAAGPSGPFVAVNCGGIVPTLLESELFGHERGSFTGAAARKIGKLELAGEGTIFFDEVGDLPLDLQAKLLRALQEEEFERVGGTRPIPLRARVMAATHRDLDAMVAEGVFRQDLFFRLAVARLHVPALRERAGDIPLIAEFLLGRIATQLGKPPVRLTEEAVEVLRRHSWPGNVRELRNVLTRAAAVTREDVIAVSDLELAPPPGRSAGAVSGEILPLREVEKRYVAEVLDRLGWNITRSAAALDISPTTLRKKINDYGLRGSPELG